MCVYTIVKFTQLCSKFLPTVFLNFACDWLALDRDMSFGRLTSTQRVMLYPYRELTITSKVQECCGREFAAELGEFDYSLFKEYYPFNVNKPKDLNNISKIA